MKADGNIKTSRAPEPASVPPMPHGWLKLQIKDKAVTLQSDYKENIPETFSNPHNRNQSKGVANSATNASI